MIDRVRLLVNRPLSDGERRRLFALAVAAILATVAALALTDGPRPRPQRVAHSHMSTAPASTVPRASGPGMDAVSLQAPSEEGRPAPDLQGTLGDVNAAKHAARRFLAGYLRYSYGRASARDIPAAAVSLRRRLAARPPRVPARERRRHPTLVLIQSDGIGPCRAILWRWSATGASATRWSSS